MVPWQPITLLVLLSIIHVSVSSVTLEYLSESSTHPSWLTFGEREYKIYSRRLAWAEAAEKCKDLNTTLAVLDNETVAKNLARHLLIGRPSLEAAWIDSVSKDSKSPEDGCLILKRHGGDRAHYTRAPCTGSRAYICHRATLSGRRNSLKALFPTEDMVIKPYGYRVFLKMVPWSAAKRKCDSFRKNYDGKLMEPRTKQMQNHLVHIMSQGELEVKHLWLGGRYGNGKWYWSDDKSEIDTKEIEGWLSTEPFKRAVGFGNTCLNVDNENFTKSIFYGIDCSYPQVFVCSFPVEKFKQLQKDENRRKADRGLNQPSKRKHKKNSGKA